MYNTEGGVVPQYNVHIQWYKMCCLLEHVACEAEFVKAAYVMKTCSRNSTTLM